MNVLIPCSEGYGCLDPQLIIFFSPGVLPSWCGLSNADGDAAASIEQLGLQQLGFDRCFHSEPALVPHHVSLKRFLQSLSQAFKHLYVFPEFLGNTLAS